MDLPTHLIEHAALGLDSKYLKLDSSNDPITGDTQWSGETREGTGVYIETISQGTDILGLTDSSGINIKRYDGTIGVGVGRLYHPEAQGYVNYLICKNLQGDFGCLFDVLDSDGNDQIMMSTWAGLQLGNDDVDNIGSMNIVCRRPDAQGGNTFQVTGSTGDITGTGTINLTGTGACSLGGALTAPNFASNVAAGTQPYACISTTLNTNLNADLLDGYHASSLLDSKWLDGGSYLYPDSTYADNIRIADNHQLQFRNGGEYIASLGDKYLDFVTPTDGACRFAQTWNRQVLIGDKVTTYGGYNSCLRVSSGGPPIGAADVESIYMADIQLLTDNWTGDPDYVSLTGLLGGVSHQQPYIYNYGAGSNYRWYMQTGRDWVTPNTPTCSVRTTALQMQVYNDNDYINSLFTFYEEMGRQEASSRNAKTNSFYGGQFGRWEMTASAGKTSYTGASYGLSLQAPNVGDYSSLNSHICLFCAMPTLGANASQDISYIYGIRLNRPMNNSATYKIRNFYGLYAWQIYNVTGGSSYLVCGSDWDTNVNDNCYGFYFKNINSVYNTFGIYLKDLTGTSVYGIYIDSNLSGSSTTYGIYNLSPTYLGDNVTLPTSGGVQIATATNQLLGFYGATPVNQPDTVSDATTQDLTGSDTVDQTKLEADLTSCKDAINAIIDRLQELGLVA